jgi:peptidoglycan/xylan/chitin deacetylase (PgdA/CDA1 family)
VIHVTDSFQRLLYVDGMKDAIAYILAFLGVIMMSQTARSDTSLTLIVTNIPYGWGTANGDTVVLIGTLNGWNTTSTATIQNHALRYQFASVSTTPLGDDWGDKPAGANLGFRFVAPDNAANTLIKTDFRSNDGNFRLALQVGAANVVEIDASPIRTLVDQASCVRVNGVCERNYVPIDRSKFAFPGGFWKALVMSYDDGHDQDRGLIPIFNQYGIKGTFHLNSSWLDTSTFVSSDDVRGLFAPHEVSVHTVSHPDLAYVSDEAIRWEVGHCRWALSQLTGYDTCSMSYPMGGYDNHVLAQLPGQGITCSRTVENTFSLDYLPVNPLKWHPTCHHANASAIADELINRTQEQMALLFIWGHSYELDYGFVDNSWAYMSALCQKLGHRGDIWYAGMEEVRAYLAAIQALTYPAENVIHNPSSSITIWAKPADTLIKIAPGKTVTYPSGQVSTIPALAYENSVLTILYKPGTNVLSSADNVYIHIGCNGWQNTQDVLLTRQGDAFTCAYAIPAGVKSLEWAFFDGHDVWDDNGGRDWSLAVRSRTTGTPASIDLVEATFSILAKASSEQNAVNEVVDVNAEGRSVTTTQQGGFGQFGHISVHYDANHLYLGGTSLNPGGNNNAVMLFLHIDTLKSAASNLWNFTGTPYGLDKLHNVLFNPGVNLAILLGDEFGDGAFMHFNLESGSDFGQGAFYIDTTIKRFIPVPGTKLSQYDGATNAPTVSSDDDSNRQTDRWEIAIPWASLNAPLGVRSIGALYVSGLIASDGTSNNDRYLSSNYLGANIAGMLDAHGNYGFNLVTLGGQRIGLADADSDVDGMSDVWENKYGFNAASAADATDDSDGDQINNAEEFVAGTNPTNGNSAFQCLEITPSTSPTSGRIIRWNGAEDRVYSVEASSDLRAPWSELAANLPPSGMWTDTMHAADQQIFYRLGVKKAE